MTEAETLLTELRATLTKLNSLGYHVTVNAPATIELRSVADWGAARLLRRRGED